jgi:hypothetical protein
MRRPALIALLCVVGVLASTATATARPPSTYRNWAQTKDNSAGVVYHPYGDRRSLGRSSSRSSISEYRTT